MFKLVVTLQRAKTSDRPFGAWCRHLMRTIAAIVVVAATIAATTQAQARPAFSAIAVDARSGKVLYNSNADSLRYPASLTKVMTLYVVFTELRAGRLTRSTRIKISRRAASRTPSKLGLRPGRTITVDHAIRALVTKSANDIATALAEHIGGSESGFAQRMTRTARSIGMTRTTFKNASGLPNAAQKTTARDMATLGIRIQRDFPQYYSYFRLTNFRYGKRNYRNHNKLLGRVAGVDGIKTGYTRASGFNLTTSARRNGKRVVAVVIGARSGKSRNQYMASLVNRMFRTKRLARGTHLALVAGKPPGYKRPTRKIARATPTKPPVPRTKPQVGTGTAGLAEEKTLSALPALPPLPDLPPNTQGSTHVTVHVPPPPASAQPLPTLPAATPPVRPSLASPDPIGLLSASQPAPARSTVVTKTQTADVPQTSLQTFEQGSSSTAGQDETAGVTDLSEHAKTWNIQVGALPTRSDAMNRLANVRARSMHVLGDKPAFTMEVQKGQKVLFRARFSGFSELSANEACQLVKRAGFKCFTLAPRG